MKAEFNIGGIGEILWDVYPSGEAFGGAPWNFICHCHSLGAKTYLFSAIGNDERGTKAQDFLLKHGVNTSFLAVLNEFETGVVNVTLDENGKPEYEIKENVVGIGSHSIKKLTEQLLLLFVSHELLKTRRFSGTN